MAMDPRNDFLRGLFTRVAGRYDLLNRVLTFGIDVSWRRRALALLDAPAYVLDLATGTADLAIGLARRFPSAHVTGIDLTPAMLEIGHRKVASAGCAARVELMEGNALALPFADATFDVVTCAFGFRNFPDKARALAETARVLRPGGTLLVLELFRMESRLCARTTSWWLRLVAPLLARGTKSDYTYLRTSIEHTVSAAEFAARAEMAGFEVVRRLFFLPSCHCLKLRKYGKLAT